MQFRTDKTQGGHEILYFEYLPDRDEFFGLIKDVHHRIVCHWTLLGEERVFENEQFNLIPKEPEYVTLYECLNELGRVEYLDSEGRFPSFNEKRFSERFSKKSLKRKTGRTLKLNLETWEVEAGE